MNGIKENISNLVLRKKELYRVLEISNKEKELTILEDKTHLENFWNSPKEAEKIFKRN